MAEHPATGRTRGRTATRQVRELEDFICTFAPDNPHRVPAFRARLARRHLSVKLKKRLLWKTVAGGDVGFLRRLIESDLATADLSANHHGWTLVHEAVDRGASGALLTLCAEIVGSVDKQTTSGISPAHVAASRGDGLALVALKMLGADLTVLAADRIRLRAAERDTADRLRAAEGEAATRLRAAEGEAAELRDQRDQFRAAASSFMQAVGIAPPPQPEAAVPQPEAPPKPAVCCVCLEHAPNAAFLPCGHKACCKDCALVIAAGASSARRGPECPVCRKPLAVSAAFVEIFES